MKTTSDKKIKLISLEEVLKSRSTEEVREVDALVDYYEVLFTLREVRENINISQEELSKRSGVPQETISRIEKGSRQPKLNTLIKLANAMGKKVEIKLV